MRFQTLATRLVGERRGNVAMIAGLSALPLALMSGFSIDLYRQHTAKQDAQASIDHAALAAAISRARDEETLSEVVDRYVDANLDKSRLREGYTVDVDYEDDQRINVRFEGGINAFFSGLIGRDVLPVNVQVTAVRGAAEAVELVLVLDNTDSMNQADAGGLTRIAALKTAAANLVNTVKENENADVKVGVVPYGEYVNVGKANKGASWLALDERDQFVPGKDQGNYPATESYCKTPGSPVTTTKTRQRDGYTETYTETSTPCLQTDTRPHPKAGEKRPDSASYTINWRWEGCIYSRLGDLRLSDAEPGTPYHGLIERDGQPDCPTAVLPLTATKSTITSAIGGMRTTVVGRIPQTYIPTGLLWGINLLSPTAPFTEGLAYASGNRRPRKIMVLMTDGENTMRYRTSAQYGYHEVTAAPGQIAQTNDDVTALCNYAKSHEIELYTVALGVSGGDAQSMLRGCASDPDKFFNAANNAALADAFADIAASINRVRLVR